MTKPDSYKETHKICPLCEHYYENDRTGNWKCVKHNWNIEGFGSCEDFEEKQY